SLVLSNKQSLFFLNQVKPFKVTWRVHVKCLHSWKINNNVDEHGEKLHVSAKRNQMYRLQRNFPIGEWSYECWRQISNNYLSLQNDTSLVTQFMRNPVTMMTILSLDWRIMKILGMED
ncbi:hypothetical protein HID58_065855, partial [Brassica napus]